MIILLIGIIVWLFYLLSRLNSLDAQVKHLSQELLRLKQALSPQGKSVPQESETTSAAIHNKKPLADIINESLGALPQQDSSPPEPTGAPLKATPPPYAQRAQIPLPRPSSAPRTPNALDKLLAAVGGFFTQGNPIVRVGMVVLFLGVSFLVNYAAGQGLLPIELRLTAVLLIAVALLILGWKTRARPAGYGLVLQGGAVAVIYLTLFAAAKLYGLIPMAMAFGLLFCVVILAAALALAQNAQVLVILASAGGFLTPLLTASGSGNHLGLLSFYLLLNLGILAIALYKTWRLLNWVGFMFTFVIVTAWAVLNYTPALYASTQPFLAAFFALYLTVAILFSLKQPANLKGLVDGSLVFGLPLITFGLQTTLLKHTQYGLAISALVLASIYTALAYGLAQRHKHSQGVLIGAFLALGIGFATLAIPLALNASWTGVSWALEACGLIWVGLRQAQVRTRIAGYLLHGAAAFSLMAIHGVHTGNTAIISGDFLALVLLALSSFTIAYLLHGQRAHLPPGELILANFGLGFGIFWWCVAGITELRAHIGAQHYFAAIIIFVALSAQVLIWVSQRLRWPPLHYCVFALLPFLSLFCIEQANFGAADGHPSQGLGLLAIGLALISHYLFLHRQEASDLAMNKRHNPWLTTWHIFSAWWLWGLIFWEVHWQQQHLNVRGTGAALLWFAAISLPMVALMAALKHLYWPFNAHAQAYKNWVPAPLFGLACLWFFVACQQTTGGAANYLPLLNRLDLAQCAVILLFAYAVKEEFLAAFRFSSRPVCISFLGLLGFIWVNVVLLRAMSHYQHIPYSLSALWQDLAVQMALSILWTACALFIMNMSRRLQNRPLWMVGASLLALVVVKLASQDLAGSGTLAGIISFMVVGALMLLIGYLSPIPAKRHEEQSHE